MLVGVVVGFSAVAQTSVASGNWSNPTTWGGTIPIGSGTVVINHDVIMDVDYAHSSGSLTINSGGSLVGNSTMRGFALNYPSGNAFIVNSGTFNIARVTFYQGNVTNSGTLVADSLYNQAVLNNDASSTMDIDQFTNGAVGGVSNNGSLVCTNFLNLESISNSGSITVDDFTNAKTLLNTVSGTVTVNYNFANVDTLSASPASFDNNGEVYVGHDFHNGNAMSGYGKMCVAHNTWNSGSVTGTLDFCDQTGSDFDLNTGTVAATVTYCQNGPCTLSVTEEMALDKINVYPNPFTNKTTIEFESFVNDATLILYNSLGQEVALFSGINGTRFLLEKENLVNGFYNIVIMENGKVKSKTKVSVIKH